MRITSTEYDGLFLEMTRLHFIPDHGWMDYSHLNKKEAMLFGTWLGQQIGKAFLDGRITALWL